MDSTTGPEIVFKDPGTIAHEDNTSGLGSDGSRGYWRSGFEIARNRRIT